MCPYTAGVDVLLAEVFGKLPWVTRKKFLAVPEVVALTYRFAFGTMREWPGRVGLSPTYGASSPASIRNGRMLPGDGSGQIAKSVKAQGGEMARLKSRVISVSVGSSPKRKRQAG